MKKLLTIAVAIALTACNSGGSAPKATTPAANSVSGGAVSVGSVKLSWNASSGTPAGYYVQQSSDGTAYSVVQTVSANSAVVSNLTKGHTYYFRVQAYNSAGASGASSTFSITP